MKKKQHNMEQVLHAIKGAIESSPLWTNANCYDMTDTSVALYIADWFIHNPSNTMVTAYARGILLGGSIIHDLIEQL